jgi:hypothetical protein
VIKCVLTLDLLVIADSNDKEQGNYFANAKQHFLSKIDTTTIKIKDTSACCNHVLMCIELAQKCPNILVVYTHGRKNALTFNGASYLDSDNIAPLYNSLVYAMACESAFELGQYFEGKHGAFIGFDAKVKAFDEDGWYRTTQISCENSGLLYALQNVQTATPIDIVYKIKENYDAAIDEMYDCDDDLDYITVFQDCSDALTFIGNPNLCIADLQTA